MLDYEHSSWLWNIHQNWVQSVFSTWIKSLMLDQMYLDLFSERPYFLLRTLSPTSGACEELDSLSPSF